MKIQPVRHTIAHRGYTIRENYMTGSWWIEKDGAFIAWVRASTTRYVAGELTREQLIAKGQRVIDDLLD